MYKVGNLVECVNNNGGMCNIITVGKRYTVGGIGEDFLWLEKDDTGKREGAFSRRFKLASFRVGDKVRIIKNLQVGYCNYDGCSFTNEMEQHRGKNSQIIKSITIDRWGLAIDRGGWSWTPSMLELISEGKEMNKYQELKARIEKVQAWDKEADDILQEISQDNSNYLSIRAGGHGSIWITSGHDTKCKADFRYTTQCEKLEAFKQSLLYLLDNSDIKKNDNIEEISRIERKIEELQEDVRRLK